MAVLSHEEIDGWGYTHEEAVEIAPDTTLPITHAARALLHRPESRSTTNRPWYARATR